MARARTSSTDSEYVYGSPEDFMPKPCEEEEHSYASPEEFAPCFAFTTHPQTI